MRNKKAGVITTGAKTFDYSGNQKTFSAFDYSRKSRICKQLFRENEQVITKKILEMTSPARRVVRCFVCQHCAKAKTIEKMSSRCAAVCKNCISELLNKTQIEQKRFFERLALKIKRNIQQTHIQIGKGESTDEF